MYEAVSLNKVLWPYFDFTHYFTLLTPIHSGMYLIGPGAW